MEDVQRPASSPGPEDPRSRGLPGDQRRRIGRGRPWIPRNPPRFDTPGGHPGAGHPEAARSRPAPRPPEPPLEPPRPSWSRSPHHPWDDRDATRWLPGDAPTRPARPAEEPATQPTAAAADPRYPRKITVTRVAAMRSRQFAEGSVRAFRRAATADGADRSGLTALTYATMMSYAVDAAVAVALANTLFFAAAKAESVTNVALYLAITAAPFAVV
ncbi:MAG TPA: MFS transporter, partial [Pseudonocardiaceae bacterium]